MWHTPRKQGRAQSVGEVTQTVLRNSRQNGGMHVSEAGATWRCVHDHAAVAALHTERFVVDVMGLGA